MTFFSGNQEMLDPPFKKSWTRPISEWYNNPEQPNFDLPSEQEAISQEKIHVHLTSRICYAHGLDMHTWKRALKSLIWAVIFTKY